jgi:hypothetical protein
MGSEVSVTPLTRFTPGKVPPVPIAQEAGWATVGLDTEARGKSFFLCRGSNLDRLVVQSVARQYAD